jgi:hypothetical protein
MTALCILIWYRKAGGLVLQKKAIIKTRGDDPLPLARSKTIIAPIKLRVVERACETIAARRQAADSPRLSALRRRAANSRNAVCSLE